MGRDPQEEEAGRTSGQYSAALGDYTTLPPWMRLGAYQTRGYTPGRIEKELAGSYRGAETSLAGELSRRRGAAGRLGSGRGYSLGLTDPFAYARMAENDVDESFASQFGKIAGARANIPLDALQMMLKINQSNADPYFRLLGLQAGNVGNRAGAVAPALVGGLLSAGGQIASGMIGAGGLTEAARIAKG